MTLRMPGEFARHERTVICWPTREEIYPGPLLDEARAAHAELAMAIVRYEPVTMIARPDQADDAARRCGDDVDVVPIEIDDSWFRDSGPTYVTGGGKRVAIDFAFNAWGEKFEPWTHDAAVARAWAEYAGHPHHSVPFVFEGGSVSSDGDGSLATTTQCLMHPNRNPSLTQREVEATLRNELGAEAVLWLPYGLALDDDTDGHVDNVACFAAPGVLVVQGCDDDSQVDHVRTDVNRRVAQGWVDAGGREIVVVDVPVLPFSERDGQRLVVPYLNYYVGNGFVVVPLCGHDADADMLAIIAEQYPDRDTFGLAIGEILAIGGGGIHCITQQVPAI